MPAAPKSVPRSGQPATSAVSGPVPTPSEAGPGRPISVKGEFARVDPERRSVLPAPVPPEGGGDRLGPTLHPELAELRQPLGLLDGVAVEPVPEPDRPSHLGVLGQPGDQVVRRPGPPHVARGEVTA